ncbi:MAG: GDP-L-fucose synthase [Myxococcales bacterium]|jgi:GDP-L-fucose synthase|nr:GDP-L-fucose synthase [Myxococcales bacterium]
MRGKVFVAGHRGLVGSAIVRRLAREPGVDVVVRTRAEVDLCDRAAVQAFFAAERPTHVFLAAAKVGGILANSTYPADFIRDNLLIQLNVIDAARDHGVEKLAFLGSSCIYPKMAPQPIREEYLLTGALEPTNAPYAVAKIAGITMVDAYRKQHGFHGISLMPTNLYGPFDNFDLQSSHVLPAMIRKLHEAKARGDATVTMWGTGTPKREFLHVDDLADASVFLMERYDEPGVVNVGTGEDLSIRELAELVARVVAFEGELVWDTTKPDGTPRKLLDVSKLSGLGWRARVGLEEGVRTTYAWFRENVARG